MKYDEIKAIVTNNHSKPFRIRMKDGTSKVLRMWQNKDVIGVLNKGKQTHGHVLENWYDHYEDWVSLEAVSSKPSDKVRLVTKRAKDAVKYLTNSGFWPDIKEQIEYFLAHEDIIAEFCKDMALDGYENVYRQCGPGQKYEWCRTYQIFESFFSKNCWKSIPYDKSFRKSRNIEVETAIKNKENYLRRWTNGYDNTIEISFSGDYPRGWLSCEYRGCGNGHYYLLFDATHAIFYEDD